MKRALITLLAAFPLALGTSVAQAHGPGHGGWGWGEGGAQPSSQVVAVAGTITSVDPTTTSFVASAYTPTGEGFGWHGPVGRRGQGNGRFRSYWRSGPYTMPAATSVTVTTNSSTKFRVGGQDGTFAGLSPGQRFVALFNGSPGDSLQTLTSAPALAVVAHTPPKPHQLYAFVGTVNAVDTSADTVTVTVSNSVPSGLVPSAFDPATFTLSPSTLVLGGARTNGLFGGSINDVAPGDVVAGGEVGPAGETLHQVEASPLQVLVDFPAATTSSSTTSSAVRTQTRDRALKQALALFGSKAGKKAKKESGHKTRSGKSAAKGRRGHQHSRKDAGRK